MIPLFENYAPQGPLAYLLMNKEGNMVLGLFEEKTTGRLVLLYYYAKGYYLLDPGMDFMERWMQNKASLGSWALKEPYRNIKNSGGHPLPAWKSLIIRLNLYFNLSKPLQQTRTFAIHPNYYYLYRELILSRQANPGASL